VPAPDSPRRLGVALIASLVVAGIAWVAVPAAAAGSCATSSPSGNAYSVTVCITAPGAGSTITGSTAVTTTISVTGTNPGVREVLFTLNGSGLLWDFTSPYTWTLDSTRWIDGTYSLHAYAIMRDSFTTSQAAQDVTFGNGITSPPVNSGVFTPPTGSTPPPGQQFVVAAVGDGGSGQTAETNVVHLISSWNPDLFLYLGDVYENGRGMEFDNWYGKAGVPGAHGQFYSISDPAIGSAPANKNYIAETNWLTGPGEQHPALHDRLLPRAGVQRRPRGHPEERGGDLADPGAESCDPRAQRP